MDAAVPVLGADDARALRLASLLLAPGAPAPASVADVVTWLGAMQAQDLGSGLWSLGVRLPGATRADVCDALERREALRTWPMRGTVHLVPARDARWMVEVLGARALARAASRRAVIGLDDRTADRAVDVLGQALAGGGRLTRAQCLAALAGAGLPATGQLGYHLLWYACQRGVTCVAPNVGTEQTFVLLDEWVPDPHRPDRDEALVTMALRYFRSHGPASRQDFAGWADLTAADAKKGIAGTGDALVRLAVGGREVYAAAEVLDAVRPAGAGADGAGPLAVDVPAAMALPGFDEFLLGFKDRALVMEPEHLAAVVPGGNGMFLSTVVVGGRVAGTWRRSASRTRTVVEVRLLVELDAAARAAAAEALEAYGRFTGLPVEVRWS